MALVLFLGGYTLAEVAAFRYCVSILILATLHSVSQVASDSDWLSVCGGRHQQFWWQQACSWHGKTLISFLKICASTVILNIDILPNKLWSLLLTSSTPHNWILPMCSMPLHYGKITQIRFHKHKFLFLTTNLKAQARYCWWPIATQLLFWYKREISGEVPIRRMQGFTFHYLFAMWSWCLKVLRLLLMPILDLRYLQCRMRKRTPRPPSSGIILGSTQCSQTPTTLHASSSSEEWQTVWAFSVKYEFWQLIGKISSHCSAGN